MKKVKPKKWMILLSILTISIVPLNKTKALTTQIEAIPNPTFINATGNSKTNAVNGKFKNKTGWIYFNIYSVPYCSNGNCSPVSQIKSVMISTNAKDYMCNIGNTVGYNDNTHTIYGYTVECPIESDSNGVQYINVKTLDPPMAVLTADSMQYYDEQISGGGVSQSSFDTFKNDLGLQLAYIVNTLNNTLNTQDYNQVLNTMSSGITTTNNKVQALIDQDLNEWNEWKNTDISSSAKQQPSQQNYDSVHTFEEGIFSDLDDPNILALIDLGIDTNTNNWIWNTMTSILNANVRVMSMVISVLTLGLAKFLMGR